MNEPRRPIPQRNHEWAKIVTANLVQNGIRPNWISAAGMGFAGLCGLFFVLAGQNFGFLRSLCLLFAGLSILARLLCNMFDGMVAVEGGLGEKDGPIWNEVPDRVADVLILVGAGFAADATQSGGAYLGWISAILAIMTAYVREIGTRLGMAADFSGPFAKPQRMWVIGAACVVGMIEAFLSGHMLSMKIALWIVMVGTFATLFRRLIRLRSFLTRS
jgi:phosphatidylglycerophosphate synthase